MYTLYDNKYTLAIQYIHGFSYYLTKYNIHQSLINISWYTYLEDNAIPQIRLLYYRESL